MAQSCNTAKDGHPKPAIHIQQNLIFKSYQVEMFYFHLGDGTNHISFGLFSDYIVAAKNYTEIIDTYDFDTTGNFNTYKVLLENGRAKLYINGLLAFDLVAGSGSASYIGSGIEFGLGTSEWTGEVLVNEIRAYKNLTNVARACTMLLLGFGLLGLAGLRRKFQK